MEPIIEIKHLSKAFGANVVLKDINFTVNKGDVTCIIGASGSGKSTILRCINLLETPTSGDILYHGDSILTKGFKQTEYRVHVGMCFQSFNLFNNMTVLENCMIGQIKVLKKTKEEAKRNALVYLQKVGMAAYINARPDQISGGQKQRLSIARALVRKPEIYIFDDSFSALDFKTDAILRAELKKETADAIVLIVAQRIGSIMEADKIIVLDEGKVVGCGKHKELLKSCSVYKEIALSQLTEEELA